MKYYIHDCVLTYDNIVDVFGHFFCSKLVTEALPFNLIIILTVFLEPACQYWMEKYLMIIEADDH